MRTPISLKALLQQLTRSAFEEGDAGGFLHVAELDLDFEMSEPGILAPQAEALAGREDLNPDTSRHLWELAARAHRHGKKSDESNRCLENAAECYVKMSAGAGSKGMAAASWLMDAIEALRGVPGTKARRQELEAMLREAQAAISDEMSSISTEIDLTDLADHARRTVSNLTLARALLEFARLDGSPEPDKLRDDAIAYAQEHPLSSIIPVSIHDHDGKVIAKTSGLAAGGDQDETAMRHLIMQLEGFRRQICASGTIEAARRLIMYEHPLHMRHFLPLAHMSPLVPAGREEIYALGFARFFGGDYISAVHVLVPQLENSLRYVLRQAAIDPSSIQSDMTQENWTMSTMLEKYRAELEKIFGSAIIYEIENLFHLKGGPLVRHQLAHGLLSSGACRGPDAVYACWFLFRLCCVPLFRHWQQVADVYRNV